MALIRLFSDSPLTWPMGEIFEQFQAIFDVFSGNMGEAIGGKSLAGEGGDEENEGCSNPFFSNFLPEKCRSLDKADVRSSFVDFVTFCLKNPRI